MRLAEIVALILILALKLRQGLVWTVAERLGRTMTLGRTLLLARSLVKQIGLFGRVLLQQLFTSGKPFL